MDAILRQSFCEVALALTNAQSPDLVTELVREIQSCIMNYRAVAYIPGGGNPKRKN
jgi:uridylate kinase